jgi:RNA polymerase sigma factor (sigma-70 family)
MSSLIYLRHNVGHEEVSLARSRITSQICGLETIACPPKARLDGVVLDQEFSDMAAKLQADEGQERALVIRAQNGDEEAFAELWQLYWKKLWTLCFRIVGQRDVAEDLAQEALLKAWVELATFNTEDYAHFDRWLLRIARNLCIDWIRRKQRGEKLFLSLDDLIGDDQKGATLEDILPQPGTIELENDYVFRVTLKQLQPIWSKCWSELPAKRQTALLLIFCWEGSFEELGWRTGTKKEKALTHNAAFQKGKYHVRTALEKLAECLCANGVELAPSQLLQLLEEQGNGGPISYETNEH